MERSAERSHVLLQGVGLLAVAGLSVLTWYGWLGWDHEHQVDPATGVASGPYQAWQVIGCGVALLVLLAGALLAGVWPPAAAAVLTLAFTAAWTVRAADEDETGMYGVGTLLLLAGLGVTSGAIAAVFWLVRRRRAGRPPLAPS